MRNLRIIIGAVLLVVLTGASLAGVWILRESGGGGLNVSVEFADAKGISADHDVIYGDTIIGRVRDVRDADGRTIVNARIAVDHADLIQQGSRFWIGETLSGAVLMVDTPRVAGGPPEPGQHFTGLAAPPETDPALVPFQKPGRLDALPSWLCEVRVTLEIAAGGDLTEVQRRKSAAAVIEQLPDGDLLVLAPSWPAQYSGELIGERFAAELLGGETLVAEPLSVQVPFMVLRLRDSSFSGNPASLWPEPLADGQGLVLTDFEGTTYFAEHAGGKAELKAPTAQGFVAMVDGTNVAGFTIPAVGQDHGVRWIPLNGAGNVILDAKSKRD